VLRISERLVNQRAECAIEIEEHQLAELLPCRPAAAESS
jgi:hypothetical protein